MIFVAPAYSSISTAWDYAIFCQMYLNNGVYDGRQIISGELVALATTPHTRELYAPEKRENMNTFYGYGWSVAVNGVYSHGGSDGTWAWVDPTGEIVGIVFTQSPGGANLGPAFSSRIKASIVDRN